MLIRHLHLAISLLLLPTAPSATAVGLSSAETWKINAAAATQASKQGHFAEAEKLLLANVKVAETFPPKDARLPRTLFDLAQVYRAEVGSPGTELEFAL